MLIKKIVLIEPEAPGDHVYSAVRMPRLGLPLLGALLKERGYQVKIFIGKRSNLSRHQLQEADLVGISTTTSTALEAYRISGYLRDQGIPVVIGGIHATFLPDEALSHSDYVVRGEAEHSFPALVEAVKEEREPEGIPGVSYWSGNRMVHNPGNNCWADVNTLPPPDLSLIHGYFSRKVRTFPVMTSRGCPYDCNFCSVTPMFGRRFRHKENSQILQELSLYQGRNVFFIDDNFAANTKHTKELLREMMDRKINLRWWGAQVRVEVAWDEELLELMKKTNAGNVYIGFESINPETLEAYNKKQSVEDIKESINRFHRYGIKVHGMFVFGGDGDTRETIRETVDFALQARIDTVQFLMLTPIPGTTLYDQLVAEDRLITRNWELYDGHHVVFYPRKISPEELQEETVKAFKKFYSFRNLGDNIFLTGPVSALYRGIGWWIIRHWEKQNRWFGPVLQEYLGKSAPTGEYSLQRRIRAFKKKRLTPLRENLLQVYLSRKEGVFYLRIKGTVNRNTLKALYKEINRAVPGKYFDLVIKTEGVQFTSEKTAEAFSRLLNNLGDRARQLKVICRVEDGMQKLVDKYTSTIPRFDLVYDRD